MADEKAAQITDEEIEKQLELHRKRRRELKDGVERSTKMRRLLDVKAIADIEEKYGPQNIEVREVAFIDADTPILLAVRTPRSVEMKLYRDTVNAEENGGTTIAAQQLGEQCLVYPDNTTYQRMKEERNGITVQLGLAALALSSAGEERRGKG